MCTCSWVQLAVTHSLPKVVHVCDPFLYLSPSSFSISVARIKFSQPQYTVKEGPQICLDIINELYDPQSPLTERIIITANIGK